jgi:FecR protein
MSTFEHKPQRPPEIGPLPSEQELEQWLTPLRDEYLHGEALSRELEARDEDEQRARRSRQVQHLAQLIRKVPEQQQAQQRQRKWTLFAAASVLALVGTSAVLSALPREIASVIPTAAAPAHTPESEQATQPAAQTSSAPAGASLRQVVGRVVATRADGQPELASINAGFAAGDEVSTTADAFASLDVGRSRVDLASASTLKLLRVGRLEQAFQLNAGRVDLSIPRVPGESRLVQVYTADTVVTVKGTVFSVEVVHRDERVTTVVQVTRGLVAVLTRGQEHLVHPGETWSSAPPSEPFASEPAVRAGRLKHGAAANKQSAAALKQNATDAAASSLAEQNRLFARALEARDAGDDARARAILDDLIRRFPMSPLRSSAMVERSTIIKRLDLAQPR